MANFSTKTIKHIYWQRVKELHWNLEHTVCDLPLAMLKVQGSPSLGVTSGQLGLVFHVLANVPAVPSINPFVVLKSSASTSLKSPQRPGQRYFDLTLTEVLLAKGDYFTLLSTEESKHTTEFSLIGHTGFDVNLHNGCELNLKIKSIGGVDYNEECRWAEGCNVICGGKNIFTVSRETVLL